MSKDFDKIMERYYQNWNEAYALRVLLTPLKFIENIKCHLKKDNQVIQQENQSE